MKAIDAEREKKLLSHGSHKISSVSLSLCRIFGAIERIERRNYHQPRTSGADTTRKKTNYGKTSPCNMTTWRYGIHDNITVKRIIINRQRSKSKNEIELPIRLRESQVATYRLTCDEIIFFSNFFRLSIFGFYGRQIMRDTNAYAISVSIDCAATEILRALDISVCVRDELRCQMANSRASAHPINSSDNQTAHRE